MTTAAPPVDLTLLTRLLERYNGRSREALLPFLHQAQEIYGWLPPEVQEAIGKTLRVPLADIHGVIEFYTMLYNKPTARQVIRVCEDLACSQEGSHAVIQAISEATGLEPGETDADCSLTFEAVPCLGMCEHAPCALNGERPAGSLTAENVPDFLANNLPEVRARPRGGPFIKLARVGKINPASLVDYEAHAGYTGLRKAVDMTPEQLIEMVDSFAILGRGGAMFPLGRKWFFTRGASDDPRKKHIVVNADESEPGTFKDRCLMEEDPFAVIEAMTIAAYAVGAENGWIFVRGEYPRAHNRLHHAVDEAMKAGYLGQNILGKKGFNFTVHVRLGAGAYICGEETALFEAIEGKRGFPRMKPPYPTTHGLFGQPTAVNNVETLVAMLAALTIGEASWNMIGSKESPGTKLFCLSGDVADPGIYEVPFGLTIRNLIGMAGGVPNGKAVQAVLMGGAAGVFIGSDKLDTPLTYEDAQAAGIPLGSGVIMVFDETADLRQHLLELAHFFAHESCGKCFPCQIGTQRQLEILDRIAHNGGPRPSDKQTLLDVGFTMTETSLCGLGQTAASAIVSAIELWPELVE
ncbi:NAD(P)H-dependent oxidoreductase subunit E [Candidatus Leptofilum sp.]|uniref:NAD(P)H-dependent oxidoreductase subunit E n=1 Tax=Candidatus Leptofilum sp. TaxID=3241576 RepID=UPI003B5C1E79